MLELVVAFCRAEPDVCEVCIRLWNRTGRISHAEALMSMSEAVVNSSPLLFRCVFVGDSSIFVTNIFSLILGIFVALLARPDGENVQFLDLVNLPPGRSHAGGISSRHSRRRYPWNIDAYIQR